MLPRGALVPRDDSVTEPLPVQMGVTWCAVEEVTTHTSTPRCGSVIANSTGAALWSATHVASGQRCSPANNGIMCKWTEQITTSEDSGVQRMMTASFCTSNVLWEKNKPTQWPISPHYLHLTDGAFWLAGCCDCFGNKGNRIKVMLTTTWQPFLSLFF